MSIRQWFSRGCNLSTPRRQNWDLSTPLMRFNDREVWTIGDACQGTMVMGATGAGKTTGAGAALALAFLRQGFGGLILACKVEERQLWETYCRWTGRSQDLVIFDASGQQRYSFLAEEALRSGAGAGLTENLVNLLSTCLEIAERTGGASGGRDEESYWKRSSRQLIRNATDLLLGGSGRVTIPDLYRVVVSAPTSREQLADPHWQEQSFLFQTLRAAESRSPTLLQRSDLELVADYFLIEYPQLSERTRSVIVSSFTSLIDILNRSLLRTLFSTDTTIRPEATREGSLILVDLPVKEFAEVGTIAAVIMKYCWQRAIERQDVRRHPRPVFLFADEFQHFTVTSDQLFQSTARSARVATVYLTQNLSNLLAAFGGPQAQALTDSMLGNLATKLWHANGDPVTNEWAANVIGRTRQYFMSGGRPSAPPNLLELAGIASGQQGHTGFAEKLEHEVAPRRFTQLRTGGPTNAWQTDVILFQGGRRFMNGKTWLSVTFPQQRTDE